MKNGDTVRLARVKHIGDDPREWFEYTPNKGYVFVAVILGVEPRKVTDETRLDPNAALRDLGWCPEDEVEPEAERIAEVLATRPAVWEQVQRLMAVATEPLVASEVTATDIERARALQLEELRRQSDAFVDGLAPKEGA